MTTYLICPDPDCVNETAMRVCTTQSETAIPQYVNHMATKFPNINILVFKLVQSAIPKVQVEVKMYQHTDNGEVLPL